MRTISGQTVDQFVPNYSAHAGMFGACDIDHARAGNHLLSIAWEAAPVLAESIGGLQAEGANRADQSALADPSALNDTTWANSPAGCPSESHLEKTL